MAKNTFADLDVTPANNADLLSQNATGNADANTIDTLFQNFAAMTARFYGDVGGLGAVGGSGNAITLTSLSTYQTYETGIIVAIKAGAANSGAATLNLDGLGAKAIRKPGDVALTAGEIAANGKYLLIYDSAYNSSAGAWVLLNPSIPANTYQPYDADLVDVAAIGVAAFSGLLYGLTLSNNASDATNDIDIAAGIAIDATNAKFLKLASGITKRLDAAWTVGTNQGGLDTGSIANTTYHVWLIMRSDTGVVDVLFSTSASSPTMPTNYDYKRRIGSIVRSGAAIVGFVQNGDRFDLKAPTQTSDTNPGTSAVLKGVTVPAGIRVLAHLNVGLLDSTPGSVRYLLVTNPATTDTTPSSSAFTLVAWDGSSNGDMNASSVDVVTDTSSRVRYRLNFSDSDIDVTIVSMGWTDTRGRIAA